MGVMLVIDGFLSIGEHCHRGSSWCRRHRGERRLSGQAPIKSCSPPGLQWPRRRWRDPLKDSPRGPLLNFRLLSVAVAMSEATV